MGFRSKGEIYQRTLNTERVRDFTEVGTMIAWFTLKHAGGNWPGVLPTQVLKVKLNHGSQAVACEGMGLHCRSCLAFWVWWARVAVSW